ncbi:hypothetical protein [Aquimarina sp. SS2-1]|uniref:hypothetical protein n=1 Tax=Aquimarina besae TaxID=3342247 RepID=UPI00366EBB4E
MAHENLKFVIRLEDLDVWQPVFGSQDYGTFYMIYIKINSIQDIPAQGGSSNTFYLYNCDFKLQNYRGAITMGLSGSPDMNFEDSVDGVDVFLNISVSPFLVNNEILNEDIILNSPLEAGMTLQTNFTLNPPPQHLFDPSNPDKSVYLNPYRLIRDGEAYSEISTRKLSSNAPFPIPKDIGCKHGPCIPDRSIIK